MKPASYIDISISGQRLSLIKEGRLLQSYPISTAKNGAGELMGSECTPTGWHRIRAKIGANQPECAVFVGRRPTGEIYSTDLQQQNPQRDWVLTRILWLGGLEPGLNRYGKVDSTWRYIYIHGCPDEKIDGSPGSHGCVRMKNLDLIELFDRVDTGLKVYIHD